MTARGDDPTLPRSPIEIALRNLGARRYGSLVEIIEHAIRRPDGRTGTILKSLTEPTSMLHDWTVSERAHALWRVIEEGIVHPEVSSMAQSRSRRVLQAAFRLPDPDVGEEWGASLTDRFKQLKVLKGIFNGATTTQPMEIAWKHGVERLAEHLEERFDALGTPDDWARYRRASLETPRQVKGPVVYRRPSEGAQKLFVNLHIMTVIMQGRTEIRRISERLITSQDENGLNYFRAWSFSSESALRDRTYAQTYALWGCRAEHVMENGLPVTQLWFPRPLRTGEQAHFVSEVVHETTEEKERGWANVEVDHFGIAPGELRGGVLPVGGLTIRIRFDRDDLPLAVWCYAEQNERERYEEPRVGSGRRLDLVCGDVVKTFPDPCQPRESYGIAYSWFSDDRMEG